MATEKLANNAGSTLSGSISNSVTSLTVASAAGFPTSGNFRILIESEILLVTAVSGTTFTVSRGQDGTSAASHASSSSVDHILTRDGMKKLRADMVGVDVWASRPTSELEGRIFLPLDGRHLHRENGSSWQVWGPFNKMQEITPILFSAFDWESAVNAGTETNLGGTMRIEASSAINSESMSAFAADLSVLGVDKDLDWQMTAHIWGCGIQSNYAKWGLYARSEQDPGPTDKLWHSNTWGIALQASGVAAWINEKWKQGTAFYGFGFADFRTVFDSNQTVLSLPVEIGKGSYWSRVSYISGDYVWEVSLDGLSWYQQTSYDDSWGVHDTVGIFVTCQNSARVICCCDSFFVENL